VDPNPQTIARDLESFVAGEVFADPLRRTLYSTDASIYQIVPACVVIPRTKQDVVRVVRYAAENHLPIVARGAGTGLAGESLCRGIVLDMSKYLNHIVEIDPEAGTVTCQAGVVLERLNSRLARLGKRFGPDPSSGNRATIGGMIANNATGAHSIKYGYTDAYIEQLEVVLADGKLERFGPEPLAPANPQRKDERRAGSLPAAMDAPPDRDALCAAVHRLVETNRELITRCMPRSERNRSGYALDKVVQNGSIHLGRLIAGSEGTLGIVTEARLRIVDAPKQTGLLHVYFDSLEAMARAVPVIVAQRPATCELMDAMLMALARSAYPQYRDVFPSGVAASLLVEVDADSPGQLQDRLRQVASVIPPGGCLGSEIIESPEQQQRLWASRKAAVPLLFRRPGRRSPTPFIEDIAVPVDRLAEFLAELQVILQRYGLTAAFYAHAGHGQLHTRPFLDLSQPVDVARMRKVAEEAFGLAWRLGGTISGEHGDGLVRVEFIKQQYGQLYPVMQKIKDLFDPKHILNPGKIIPDGPAPMTRALRAQRHVGPDQLDSILVFRGRELADEAERCNGDGQCRSLEAHLTMCPVFRALRDESACPRGFASLVRGCLNGLLDPQDALADELAEIFKLCLQCKLCRFECPSAVNVPKLVLEARARHAAAYGLGRTEWLLARSETIARLGALLPAAANAVMTSPTWRWILEKLAGIDRRRQLPMLEARPWIRRPRENGRRIENPVARVVYFADSFASFYDRQLARDTVAVLEHNRVQVELLDGSACGMPAIVYGDAQRARRLVRRNVARLARYVRQGYQIVCSEPTATLCLKQEYTDWDDSFEAVLVANHTQDVCAFLRELDERCGLRSDFEPLRLRLAYHAPCHLKALQIGQPGLELLRRVPGVQVEPIQAGCCGIGGTFGFQARHYALSMQIGAGLIEALRNDAVGFGATECSTCKLQMEQASGQRVLHPVSILARAYNLRPEL